MSAGLSLMGLMLALALGSSVTLLAMERYQSLGADLARVGLRAQQYNAARLLLFELARDWRQHGWAGCHALPQTVSALSGELRVEYGQSGWQILQTRLDPQGRLLSLWLDFGSMGPGETARLVLSSCQRVDVLARDQGLLLQEDAQRWRMDFAPGAGAQIGGANGHHLETLELAPLLARRYRLQRDAQGVGVLLRWQEGQGALRMIERVRDFSWAQGDDGTLQLQLQLEQDTVPWRLSVASRQRGMALLLVMTLLLCCSVLLAALQGLQLDETRQLRHQQDWWQAMQFAEYALAAAEQGLGELGRATGSAAWFSADCQSLAAPAAWRAGLCARAGPDGVSPPPWRRAATWRAGAERCMQIAYPHYGRKGPAARPPCAIIELLDPAYPGGGLYRVTVRAWGRDAKTMVHLQSYFQSGATAHRLAWRELF
jgi:type IV pilus assembly protein PilX